MAEHFELMPNPFRESFEVKFPENSKSSYLLQVRDMVGRLVYSATVRQTSVLNIDASTWSAASYTLTITNNDSGLLQHFRLVKLK